MVAEEYAIHDNLTRGLLIAGFVRGIAAEYHAMGINPATIRWSARMRYTYCQTLSPIAAVARFFQMCRYEADQAGYQSSPDQLAWSNTIYVAETDEKAVREARPHLEAL